MSVATWLTTRKVGLVACGKAKLAHSAPASELYSGPLFRAAAAYAAAVYDEWWVLSALHGLIHPTFVLSPYDDTLADRPPELIDRWAHSVDWDLRLDPFPGAPNRAGLERRMEDGTHIELFIHAGRRYRDPLLPLLKGWSSATVHVPLAGLGIGQQLAWYAARLPVEALT